MYKDLNLNREKLLPAIKEFCEQRFTSYNVSDLIPKGGPRNRVEIAANDIHFFIDFHFNKKGSTSIDISGGDHSDIKKELADYIISDKSCKIGDLSEKNKTVSVKNISRKDFEIILEILKSSEFAKPNEIKVTQQAYDEIYRLSGKYGDQLTVHYYPTTNRVKIEGRPLHLFNEAFLCLTQLVDGAELDEILKKFYNIEIDKKDIIAQYQTLLPNSAGKHSEKLEKYICQAIYNYNLTGDMFEYGSLIFPVFKALEGHLKNVLYSKHGIECKNGYFNMFDPVNDDEFILQVKYHPNCSRQAQIDYFGETYSYFHKQRHSLFHWGDPSLAKDQTRLVDDITEAQGIIIDTLNIIDKYYIL
jgi:ribonuclease HI